MWNTTIIISTKFEFLTLFYAYPSNRLRPAMKHWVYPLQIGDTILADEHGTNSDCTV